MNSSWTIIISFILAVLFILILGSRFKKKKPEIKLATIDKDSIAPFGLSHNGLAIGDRLVIFAGYDYKPKYLGDNDFYIGEIVKFIPGQAGRKSAPVLRMDKSVQFDTLIGQYFVIETRHVGQDWNGYGAVHVELCDFEPESIDYEQRDKGLWIEAAASYEFEERYFDIKNMKKQTTNA